MLFFIFQRQRALLKILYKTSLASSLFIDFPVPIQESERFLRFFEWNLELFGWGGINRIEYSYMYAHTEKRWK